MLFDLVCEIRNLITAVMQIDKDLKVLIKELKKETEDDKK